MAVEERYLKEKREEWTFYRYHNEKWLKVFEEIDQELKLQDASKRKKQWEQWANGFLLFYKDTIAQEVSGKREGNSLTKVHYSTKETFREFHSFERNANSEKYKVEADFLLSSICSSEKKEGWREWLLTGWFPHLNFESIQEEEKLKYRIDASRLVIGALSSIMASDYDHKQQMKRIVNISVLMAALEIPIWLWPELLHRIDGLKAHLHSVFCNINMENRPLLKINLGWDKSGTDSHEESIYQKIHSEFENEEILKVARRDLQLNEMRRELPRWADQLMALCYAVEPQKIAQLITPEKNPFVFKSICSNPLYQHDLKFLLHLASEAGIWGRIEITKHILALYNDRNVKLSHRLLLLIYLKKCYELLIKLDRADVLVLLLDRIIIRRIEGEQGNLYWLGSCLGDVLHEMASPLLIENMFDIWGTPYIYDNNNLEKILIEIRLALQKDGESLALLTQWDLGIVNIWIKSVLQMYFMKNKDFTAIGTLIENAILPILIERYSNQKNLSLIMDKLTDRWFRIESQWFPDFSMESKRKNGLLTALLTVVFVAANMDADCLDESRHYKKICENLLLIVDDKRNWNVNVEAENLQTLDIMNEMKRALNIILDKLQQKM